MVCKIFLSTIVVKERKFNSMIIISVKGAL